MSEKWALVTGASSGIGWATALELAKNGFHLILQGRREQRLSELAGKISQIQPNVKTVIACFDLQNREQILRFSTEQQALIEKLDLLVNNAGLACGTAKLQDGDFQDWDQMIDTNIKGLLGLSRVVLPAMIKKNRGHVVNLGSVAGRWAYPGGAVYAATKFAVRALSEGMRMDLLGTALRVTNIEPGMVETEFSIVRLKDAQKASAVYEGMTPLTAQDIAETITWVITRPAHVNVQELVIFPTDQAGVGYVHRR